MDKNPQLIIDEAALNNEPIFIIRGKDRAAVETLTNYLIAAENLNAGSEFAIDMLNVINKFIDYRMANSTKMKVPDL